MFRLFLILIGVMITTTNTSCSRQTHTPVVETCSIESIPQSGIHKVMAGETLYSIAWRYGLDYRYVARRNQLKSPYTIHVGQSLDLAGDHEFINLPNINLSSHLPKLARRWQMPAKGSILTQFSVQNKGIDIGGKLGDAIFAAHHGKVVYCGNGLTDYGNLIILKHNGEYLSSYAYNRAILVKLGDEVRQGQQIAEMGRSAMNQVKLHFEIRRLGKPIDPFTLLRF